MMRKVYVVSVLGLAGLFLIGAAWAFRPGPSIIRACPKCGARFAQETTMSGNTLGARLWTDGKIDAPMLPDRPRLVKCYSCGALIWVDEARKVGEQQPWKGRGGLAPRFPSENDYLTFLSQTTLTREKELYARRRAWWAANDTVRKSQDPAFTFSPAQERNLQALSGLMDEKDPDQRLAKAEILRELGKFGESLDLLKLPFDETHHKQVSALIERLAGSQIRSVREVGEERP